MVNKTYNLTLVIVVTDTNMDNQSFQHIFYHNINNLIVSNIVYISTIAYSFLYELPKEVNGIKCYSYLSESLSFNRIMNIIYDNNIESDYILMSDPEVKFDNSVWNVINSILNDKIAIIPTLNHWCLQVVSNIYSSLIFKNEYKIVKMLEEWNKNNENGENIYQIIKLKDESKVFDSVMCVKTRKDESIDLHFEDFECKNDIIQLDC